MAGNRDQRINVPPESESESESGLPIIPYEIATDILLRLPVKSICRFRCVSKPWLSLLSDPKFIRAHLNRNRNNNERLIMLSSNSKNNSLYSIETLSCGVGIGDGAVAVKLEFPNVENPNDWYEIWGSCDGLLLVSSDLHNHFLLNPSTKESKIIPKSPFSRKLPKSYYSDGKVYGFGFDSTGNDYKVVRIFSYRRNDEFPRTFVSVYSLRTNSWKKVESSPYDHSARCFPGVFLNGNLHWLAVARKALDYEVTIASFDLSNDKFDHVPMPSISYFDEEDIQSCELGALRGCLSVFFSPEWSDPCVFIMTEYGNYESWVKFKIHSAYYYMKPLVFSEKHVVIVEQDGEKLILYNIREKTSSEVMIHGKPDKFEAVTYVESLVSPKSDNETERHYPVPQQRKEKRKNEVIE